MEQHTEHNIIGLRVETPHNLVKAGAPFFTLLVPTVMKECGLDEEKLKLKSNEE